MFVRVYWPKEALLLAANLHADSLLCIWKFGFLAGLATEALFLTYDYVLSTVILSTYFTQSDP
jgi:hypothetical protein